MASCRKLAARQKADHSWPAPSGSDGFTLLEMVVVLVVLGLVMGLVLARGPMHSRTVQTHAVAAEIARALRSARGTAIATDRPVEVVFDLTKHGLSIDSAPLRVLPGQMTLSVSAASGQTLGARLAGIRFAPDGSSSGGQIVLAAGGVALQVSVDWLTGRTSIADAPHT